ncbi:similar to Saccharomyces cerevisiae YGL114W Putative protein of unknown function [Maudiozyma barnettii]|uniref:Uncharacterized protein n=1 Tax=Maudiozyma barnettii TaxID=61262 RepID=A0A8H2VKP4_9SACH|nr:hypothetical protein [Kazachstania barnettii]CAB4257226.1 similar to Saccharomyces cerevisiae YGL114W Putative protein of unknown function [Kazachstania barnettii]CAD1779596.1 similar to Saccharomyces cerevisiae YGL114W Putative protein of unknown function [Kazachstania barnettii]
MTDSRRVRSVQIRHRLTKHDCPETMPPWEEKPAIKQVTMRGTIVGLAIGSIVLISNFQFGLQTGWVSMMSLPSALLAVAFFKQVWPLFYPQCCPFSDVEIVYVQSLAVAVGTGPLSFGFIGVIPAIEKFVTFEESGYSRVQGTSFSLAQLLVWSCSLAFFGIFFAVPLRKQVIVKEKLRFPSGSATAILIAVLSGSEVLQEVTTDELMDMRNRRLNAECPEVLRLDEEEVQENDPLTHQGNTESYNSYGGNNTNEHEHNSESTLTSDSSSYGKNMMILTRTFIVSAVYTIASYFLPIMRSIPVFGRYASKHYLWNFQPSPAYIGQGIIMGLPTVSYMLFGSFLGWIVLASLAKHKGWVQSDADVGDWEHGVQGWILWCSLSIMVADSVVGFLVVTTKSLVRFMLVDDKAELLNTIWDDSLKSLLLEEERALNKRASQSSSRTQETIRLVSTMVEHEVDSRHLVTYTTVLSGLVVSSMICVIFIVYLFGSDIIPVYSMVIALIFALLLSILGIRALGETDLNPVSGIGKLSQLIFALIIPKNHPGNILLNIVAGGVTEAGAQQAGDLMQDLKTGHLLNASPRAQFIAQLIGVVWSIVLSSVMYICYNKVYDLPNDQIRIPTAIVWIDCARLVAGKDLPERALECSVIFGSIFALLSFVKNVFASTEHPPRWLYYIPSGVAVGVGIYNVPSFTIARFLGGLLSHLWLKHQRGDLSMKTSMIVFSSGLVLGEGVCSIVTMTLSSLNVPHW